MLDSFFALHPAMPEFARMYREKRAAVVHAVSTPYRDRSHFDARTCSKAALPARAGCNRAGSTARWRFAQRRAGDERACDRPTNAAGAARRRADRGWTPVALPQADDDTAMRFGPNFTGIAIRAGHRAVARLAARQTAQGDDMKPRAGHQWRRRDEAGGARRRQA